MRFLTRFNRKQWLMAGAAVILVGTPALVLGGGSRGEDAALVARVRFGEFRVPVTTSGELVARDFVSITAPPNARQAEAWQMKIASIVPEGTVVRKGDVVAELDRSTLATKLAEVSLALQKAEAVYEQAMLDSTLNLSKAREDIRTMELGLEEKKLAKEQAVYEAPSVRRQAEIDYEKAQRALAQAKADYTTKEEQARAKMREVGADLNRERNKLQVVQDVMAAFTITAPSDGMVIYVKEWNGKKKTTGSQVNAWDPTVATLPDLTKMESVTYVNEIDVRKVAVGQPVRLTLDADPTKTLSGRVTSVANVGEQRPNTDAKVFEVKIVVAQSDTTLRPGMTTGNMIETFRTDSALFVPLEALNSEGGIPIVFKASGGGLVKQEVVTGMMNDDEVIILQGLAQEDRVLLTIPSDRDRLKLVRLPESARTADTTAIPAGGDTAVAPSVPLPNRSAPAPAPSAARPRP